MYGDTARRLPAATRPRPDRRRTRAAVERPGVVRRVRAPSCAWEIVVGTDPSDDGREKHRPLGKCLLRSPLRRDGAGTSPAWLGTLGTAPCFPHVSWIMRTIVLTLLLGAALFVPAGAKGDDRLATIHLPEGFVIEAFAAVPNARQMAWGEKGTLFVGTRQEGRVFAVTDEDGDGRGERVREVASGLRMPSGVAFRDGALYVAAVSTILRFDNIESRLDDPPAPAIVTDRLPSEGHHGWKVLEFGPDGLLYLPVGAPCDVCRTEGYHGTILRMHPDGSGIEIYARGLRNSVGLAWHPVTGELWFTDNGSDRLGADLPPDELNSAPGPGFTSGSRSAMPARCPIPNSAATGAARTPSRLSRPWRRMWRRSAWRSIRNQCAASLSGRGVHRGTRTREPERNDRLPGLRRAPRRGPQDRARLRGIRPGMVRQPAGVGPAGRHPGGSRRLNPWSPTTGPGESTGSGTSVHRRPAGDGDNGAAVERPAPVREPKRSGATRPAAHAALSRCCAAFVRAGGRAPGPRRRVGRRTLCASSAGRSRAAAA